jgi:hypothetical protein
MIFKFSPHSFGGKLVGSRLTQLVIWMGNILLRSSVATPVGTGVDENVVVVILWLIASAGVDLLLMLFVTALLLITT